MSPGNSSMIISVAEAGTAAARVFSFKVLIEGQLLAEQSLSVVETQEVREIARQYSSLFEKGCRTDAARDYLDILGRSMQHLFFGQIRDKIEPRINEVEGLVVASEVPEVLQLPWEILFLKGKEGAGFGPGGAIRRLPKSVDGPTAFSGTLPPGPLRVLFMVCEPLDHEQEEISILRAMQGLNIAFEICDEGSFDGILSRAKSFRPHLVHLFGLGKNSGGRAHFSFEGAGGRPDLRSPEELGRSLAAAGVSCVIIGGCQEENLSSLDSLCQRLADLIPLAVAWNASADTSKIFYGTLASGNIDEALSLARAAAGSCGDRGQEIICAFPALYSTTDQKGLFDPGLEAAIPAIDRGGQPPLPGMTNGYAEDFVNRRRDLQRLTSALREGTIRTAIITGPDGIGKTSLATRLALRLGPEGYSVMPLYSSRHNPISAARLMEAAIGFLAGSGRREEAQSLRNPSVPLGERLKKMLDILERDRALIILDGLDLDERTGKINDTELSEFYLQMLRLMDRARAIITAQSLPADAPTLPRRAWEWPLLGLSEAAFIKYLLKDERVALAYRKGEVNYEGLQALHGALAPSACLPQMRRGLMAAPKGSSICDEFLAELSNSLSPEARLALAKASVYETAVTPEGLAAVAGVSEERALAFAKEWQDLSLAHLVDGLRTVPSQARPFLLVFLGPDQLREAHRAAGDFLRGIAESGRSEELRLSRLDCLLEARGHYVAADEPEEARAITARISGYLEGRGFYSEVIRLNEQLLKQERHIGPMNWIARAYLDQGKYPQAQRWYSQALEAEQNATACQGLGTIYFRQGKYDLAAESFQKAAEICRVSGDVEGEATALHALASIDMEQKREKDALEKLQRVAEIQEQMGDMNGVAVTFHDMATVDLRQGNYDSARNRLLRSLEILQAAGDREKASGALFNLASLDMEKGDFDAAREEFQKALALKRDMGDRRSVAAILHSLGSIESQAGDKEKARHNFTETLKIFQELGDKPGEAGAFFQLGAIAVQEDRIHEGLRLMALSAVVLRSIGSEEVRNVEPVVERLASQLKYSQQQFMEMVREVVGAYRRDRGWGLVEAAIGK